jgi:hypothetical protein
VYVEKISLLTLPGTHVYVEKISYIWVEIRVAQTLSSNHRKELPHAGE